MSVPVQTDPGPMARLEALKADPLVPSMIFQRLTDRETLAGIAKDLKLPKGRFFEWYTTQHGDLYDAALKVVAADLALEALAISDEQADVPRDKLRVETRLKLAAKLDRARFGESVRVERDVTVRADQALLGTAAMLLERIAGARVVQGQVVDGAGMTMAPRPELGPI